jgi:hypothetical protein
MEPGAGTELHHADQRRKQPHRHRVATHANPNAYTHAYADTNAYANPNANAHNYCELLDFFWIHFGDKLYDFLLE